MMNELVGGSIQRSAATSAIVIANHPSAHHSAKRQTRARMERLALKNVQALEDVPPKCPAEQARGLRKLLLLLDPAHRLDRHCLYRHVLMHSLVAGLDRCDRVDHIHP